MVFCKDCKYICKPAGAPYFPHPLSICLCAINSKVNYVTGMSDHVDCKDINIDGNCRTFERKDS